MTIENVLNKQKRPSTRRKLSKILAAAEEEFLANGFSATSIEAIASRANVSKVTIYNHFSDKKTLFTKLLHSQIGSMKFNFDAAKLEEKSLREILLKAMREMITFLANDKTVLFDRMLSAEVNRDPEIGVVFIEAGPKAMQIRLSHLLSESVKRGDIVSDDILASAEMLAGLAMGRLDLLLRYGADIRLTEKDIQERAERAVDAWLKIHQV